MEINEANANIEYLFYQASIHPRMLYVYVCECAMALCIKKKEGTFAQQCSFLIK